jgi:predicted RNase H-like nuclease (RuvC/YqgF family)
MRKFAAIIICIMGLNACAILQKQDESLTFSQYQEKKLAAAVKLQNEGKLSAAVESLIRLSKERGVSGVTDEALFRLTLLYLGNGLENDKESLQMAQESTERLRKEYPSSSWSAMVSPVSDLLTTMAELRRQNQNLKNQNQTFSKENQALTKETQELRETIEKLKRLDLELEQKRK